jgi:hypothetical protein
VAVAGTVGARDFSHETLLRLFREELEMLKARLIDE